MAHCSLNPSASPQLTAEIKKPAQTESLHANLMQCSDQAPAPTAGGDLARNAAPLRAGTLRVLCHACYTSRVSVHTLYVNPKCNTEYALGSKARKAQSAMYTPADKRPITPCTPGLRAPCPTPSQQRGRSCVPLAALPFHPYRCATIKLLCTQKIQDTN